MEKETLRDKYEDFHKNAHVQKKVIGRNDFTYHVVLYFIDKYLKPNMKVLDIGCGVGTISLYAASKGSQVLGTDISEKAVKAAMESAQALGIKNASFKAINFLEADFQEKFDFIICSEVIEHLPDDMSVLKKIHELLEVNGILFLSTRLENDPMHKIRIKLFKKDKFDTSVGHLRRYSKNKLIELLEASKFEIIKLRKTEGLLRMFLFTTKIGNKLLLLTNSPPIRLFLTLVDNLSCCLFGVSQILIIARIAKEGG